MTATGPAVILVGPPGSGKSTVGPLLAARLRTGFLDTDDEVEAIARKPVSDIFVEDGEQAFRAIEARAVRQALGYHGVVAEAMAALVLAGAAVEKFGGDSAEEMRRNAESYLKALVVS